MSPAFALLPLAFCLIVSAPHALAADKTKDKPGEKKPEPPRLVVAMPLAVSAGTTSRILVRGHNLMDIHEARFTNAAAKSEIAIQSKAKANVPKDADAKVVGDTQIELAVTFPAGAPSGTNWFTVSSTNGVSVAIPIVTLPADEVVEEKEPNGGFKTAQPLASGKTLLGVVKEAADVDVFRFEGRAGQHVTISVCAARHGAALDSLVTLYDAGGHPVAVNDDAGGSRDSFLQARLPATGEFFISVVDAQDRSGPTHGYLLRWDVGK